MYALLRFLSIVVAHIFFREVSFQGGKPDPDGPLLICANHSSNWDSVCSLALFPHKLRYIAKSEFHDNAFIRFCFAPLHVIYVKRDGDDHKALREMLNALKDGQQVFIFPEGHRYHTVDPQHIKPGIGFLAQRSKVDIQCYYVESNYRFRGYFHMTKRPLIRYEDVKTEDRRLARYMFTQKVFNMIYDTDYPLEDFMGEDGCQK